MEKYWNAFVSMITRPREYVFGEGKVFTVTDSVIYVAILGAIVGLVNGLIGPGTFGGEVPLGGNLGPVGGLIVGAVGAVVGLFIGAAILYLIMALLKVDVEFSRLVAASALATTGSIAGIVPIIGDIIATIWQLYLLYLALIGVADVPPDKSRTTIIIIVVIYLVIILITVLLVGLAAFAVLS